MPKISVLCGVVSVFAFAPVAVAQSMTDGSLQVVRYASGFANPTGIAFLDSAGSALVIEKDTGKVKLMQNRKVTATVLDLPVANDGEQGLLGITLSPNFATDHFVYTYHTAARADGGSAITNKISRYLWDPANKTLTLNRKIIDLPSGSTSHNGGKIQFGSDGRLYAVIGDLGRPERTVNVQASNQLSDLGVILRMQPDGRRVTTNPFASSELHARDPQQFIYAYGVRNSFGIAFDPVSGVLWDTENGPSSYDEINRVTAGMNSGWQQIMGPISRSGTDTSVLVNLGSKARYIDPKFSWVQTVAPTDLEFINSSHLGSGYRNDMIVGDVNTGSLYHFDLTSTRSGLQLLGALSDGVADNQNHIGDQQAAIIFGTGFGTTSDIINGPGGLYVLSVSKGALYRISEAPVAPITQAVPEPVMLGFATLATPLALLRRHARRR